MTKKKIYIGIDPGATGAIAIIDEKITIIDCPPTIAEMASVIEPYRNKRLGSIWGETVQIIPDAKAIIEKVNPYYKSSAKSAFTFGGNFFAWKMAFACFLIPCDLVTPRKWQKVMFDSAKKLDDTKQQSFERVTRLFPNLDIELKTPRGRILDGRCDALLIAEYLRRTDK